MLKPKSVEGRKGGFILSCGFRSYRSSRGWEVVMHNGKKVRWLLISRPQPGGRGINTLGSLALLLLSPVLSGLSILTYILRRAFLPALSSSDSQSSSVGSEGRPSCPLGRTMNTVCFTSIVSFPSDFSL